MKLNKPPQDQKHCGPARLAVAKESNQNGIDFGPLPDEVAGMAYFSYFNKGSQSGHATQHWQEAEAQLLAEGNLTPFYGFHHLD